MIRFYLCELHWSFCGHEKTGSFIMYYYLLIDYFDGIYEHHGCGMS